MTDIRLLLPLLIGHESEMLDTLTPSGQTQFRWTVFVRSAGQLQFTDRSIITKVIFELHPDFTNRRRTVKDPPFEVTETGYAGFTIPIFISFAGIAKPYKLMHDMNLVIEKQSKFSVEQMILIRPPNESFDLFMKYGARVKGDKKKKEKHRSGKDDEAEGRVPERKEMLEEKQSKRRKKSYLNEFKAETSKETVVTNDCRAAVPTTSVVSKKFTPRKVQKPFNDEADKEEKPKRSASSGRLTPPSDRSRGSANGRSSPAIERLKNSVAAKASPMNDRSKNSANGRLTPPFERPRSSNRSSPPLERAKSSSKGKLTPPLERPKGLANGKLVSPSDSSKTCSDDQSPPAKKRKQEMSVDTLLSVQKSLMDINDADKMLAVVDTIFSSSQWPIPSLEYSEDTKLLSFDLFSLDPTLISKLEELCR